MTSYQTATSDKKNVLKANEDLEFLDKKIGDAFEDAFYEYPTGEVLELVKFYEARDAKWRDRVYLLLAALIGGTVGAMMTQWSNSG